MVMQDFSRGLKWVRTINVQPWDYWKQVYYFATFDHLSIILHPSYFHLSARTNTMDNCPRLLTKINMRFVAVLPNMLRWRGTGNYWTFLCNCPLIFRRRNRVLGKPTISKQEALPSLDLMIMSHFSGDWELRLSLNNYFFLLIFIFLYI